MNALFRISILALVVLSLAGTLFGSKPELPLFLAALAALVAGFPLMSKSFRWAALVFLTLGLGLLILGHRPIEVWIRAAGSFTSVVSIVAVMQTFAVPIKVGSYDAAIGTWMKGRFRRRSSLFLFTTLTTHLLTSFLNLGSIPVMVSLFGTTLKGRVADWKRFFARATTRGFILAVFWSPGAVNLALVVQATGLSWSRVFIPGLLLAALGIGLSLCSELGTAEDGGEPTPLLPGAPDPGERPNGEGKRVFHIVVVAAIFVLVVALFEWVGIGSPTDRTVLAGALVSLGWTLTQGRKPGLAAALRAQWTEGTLKVADIAPFFVAMGFFSTALEESGLLNIAGSILRSWTAVLGGASVIPIALSIVAFSIVGLHPFITIVLFGKILSHATLPIPPLTIALSLAVGGATAYMVTPFAGVIMTIAKLIEARAVDVALRWNWRFGIFFFMTGMLFAYIWGSCFG